MQAMRALMRRAVRRGSTDDWSMTRSSTRPAMACRTPQRERWARKDAWGRLRNPARPARTPTPALHSSEPKRHRRPILRIVTDNLAAVGRELGGSTSTELPRTAVNGLHWGAAALHILYFRRLRRLRAIFRDEEAAGSNPVTPTTFSHVIDVLSVHCGSANGPVGGIWEDPLSIMDLAPDATTTRCHNWAGWASNAP
jgi:hypothetical protein